MTNLIRRSDNRTFISSSKPPKPPKPRFDYEAFNDHLLITVLDWKTTAEQLSWPYYDWRCPPPPEYITNTTDCEVQVWVVICALVLMNSGYFNDHQIFNSVKFHSKDDTKTVYTWVLREINASCKRIFKSPRLLSGTYLPKIAHYLTHFQIPQPTTGDPVYYLNATIRPLPKTSPTVFLDEIPECQLCFTTQATRKCACCNESYLCDDCFNKSCQVSCGCPWCRQSPINTAPIDLSLTSDLFQ